MFIFPVLVVALLVALLAEIAIVGVARLRRVFGRGAAPLAQEVPPPGAADNLDEAWQTPPGILGQLRAVNHKQMGIRFVVTAFFFLLLSGSDSLVLRTLLTLPEAEILGPEKFNQLFTMHGTATMFLFAVPMLEGFAVYLVPLMLGARDMPFPRLNAFGYFTFLLGGLLLYASTVPDPVNLATGLLGLGMVLPDLVPDAGWFAYPPLTTEEYSPGLNMDFWLISVTLLEISGIIFAIEIIVAILKTRAPGLSVNRIPIFVWSVLAMALAMLFAFPAVVVASLLLELERKFGFPFYDPDLGGNPLLWQHLFWIFGHPEVYIQLIPATGLISMIVPIFARYPLAGYTLVVVAIAATTLLSFGLWVHHMFATGLPWLALGFFGASSMMITIPSGVQVFAWIATFWNGRRPPLNAPVLFALGFIVTFVLGGLTGVMVASVPFDWQVHDTYFVVAHFHYVLVGGVVFPIFAGLHFWLPKATGRLLDEGLGRWTFWLWFIGFNTTFLIQHNLGLLGMPRRVFTYLPEFWGYNLISTLGAFLMAAGTLVFLWNVYRSARWGQPAGDNPWRAATLEWAVSSPPPSYNFRTIPTVQDREPLWTPLRTQIADRLDTPPADRQPVWRETLGTTALDARPSEAIQLPNPSYLPLLLAIAVGVFSIGTLFSLYVLAGLGVLAVIIVVVIWLAPGRAERAVERSGPSLLPYSVPAHVTGPRAVGWWGLVLFVVALAVILACLLFSYFYLSYGTTSWPPSGIGAPGLVLPLVSSGVLLLSAAAMGYADRGIRRGEQTRLKLGLGLGFILGAVFLGIQVYGYLQLGFAPWDTAYGAIFYTLAGFHAVVVLTGLGMNAVTQTEAWLRRFDQQRFLAVENTAYFWYFVTVAWLATAATLYLAPHLL